MLQVLHLSGGERDLQTLRTSQILCPALSDEFRISNRSIGPGRDYRTAAHAALSLRFRAAPRIDLIHAWDLPALIAALGAGLPTVFSPSVWPAPHHVRWLRAAAQRRCVYFAAATDAQRRLWIRLGTAPERCQVIPPPVHPRESPGRNNRLREQLGLAPDDYVILAPGETTSSSEHRRAVWATSILHVLDDRYRLLLWGHGRGLHLATSLARDLAQPRLMVIAERQLGRQVEFEDLPGVADAALVAARGDVPLLPILDCMAAALPIVAAHSPPVLELLRNDQNALLVEDGTPRGIAGSILKLREDPALARRLADAAARDAARFSPERFAHETRRIYFNAAGVAPPRRCGGGKASSGAEEGSKSDPVKVR